MFSTNYPPERGPRDSRVFALLTENYFSNNNLETNVAQAHT